MRLLAMGVAFVALSSILLLSTRNSESTESRTTHVYVAIHTIPEGTLITETNQSLFASVVEYYRDIDALREPPIGRVAARDIFPGDPLVPSDFR